MAIVNISLLPKFEDFGNINSGVFFTGQSALNCIYENFGSESQYVRKRPSFLTEIVSPSPNTLNSNNIFSIEDRGNFYFEVNGILYNDNYSNSLGVNGNSFEIGYAAGDKNNIVYVKRFQDIFIIDALNNISILTELNNIIGANELARGTTLLNGSVYVQRESGEIYNSSVEDFNKWNSLDFISSELVNDKALYIDSINNHIVSFNESSIEFFYDNGNSTGSRLSPRLDVSYQIGGIEDDSYFKHNDQIYFVGSSKSGERGIYVLSNFTVKKISGTEQDIFLSSAPDIPLKSRPNILLSGIFTHGRLFLYIKLSNNNNMLVYDALNGQFYLMDHIDGLFSRSSGIKIITDQGMILSPRDSFEIANDISSIGRTQFDSKILLKANNFGTNDFKRIKSMDIIADRQTSIEPITVDFKYGSFNFGSRTFTLTDDTRSTKKGRMGRFNSVQFVVSFGLSSGGSNSPVKLKSIQLDIR